MILQALTRLYEDLLERGDIAEPGWGVAKISFALVLNADGELTQVIDLMEEQTGKKKMVSVPQKKVLPAAVIRSLGIKANFLWDNSAYLLGVEQKKDPKRCKECFAAARALHHAILDGVDSATARAILRFFDSWQPDKAELYPALKKTFAQITAGKNLLFRVNGDYAQEDAAIRAAWQRHYDSVAEKAVRMQCLVTGRQDEIVLTHPSIKGVRDAQSSGAALVSFNADAFCSYGREQNLNAPVGKYAAFAYTTALNHLLADQNNVQLIGDTTLVCWVEGAQPQYASFFTSCTGPNSATRTLRDNDVRAALTRLAAGERSEALDLDPNRPFYILGLAPNAARISVRFFLRDTFGNLMKNVNQHYEDLHIAGAEFATLPLWALLQETVNKNGKDKSVNRVMAGEVARAVFSGEPYPASLLYGVLLRIRAERDVTWGRAAILKAYGSRNIVRHRNDNSQMKETATVKLDETCTYLPYVLGRLFCVMEQTQRACAGNINRSIKDSYFNAAATRPQTAFAKLLPLHEHHMKKLLRDKPALGRKYAEERSALMAKLTQSIPLRFTQEETISFYLGYYHQDVANKRKDEPEKNEQEEQENG